MRRIKKTILSLSLVAAMVMGEAGIALAAEPTATDTEAGYEITDPALNGATAASVDDFDVNVYGSYSMYISFSGNGSKFKIYVNNKLFKTIENNSTATAENPAPAMYYASATFYDMLKGGSYTIKVVPCSYSASGDVDGTPVSKTVTSPAEKLSNLNVYTYHSKQNNGYYVPYGYVRWDSDSYSSSKVEIWRKEGKSAWKKLAETSGWSYSDYSVVPGKKYQYRIRTAGDKNTYATVPAGQWLTSKATEKIIVSDVNVNLEYMDGVAIRLNKDYDGVLSGYEIYRSTKRAKGYKKIATIAEAEYTDKVKSGTYYYKVRGYYYDTNTGKKYYGEFSDIKPVKLVMGNINVTAKQSGKSAATVAWNKVSGAQKYEVWYKSDVSGDAWKLYKTTTGLSCKVTKLSNDTRYRFRVKAIKGTGSNTYFTNDTASCFIGFNYPSNVYIAKRKVTTKNASQKVTIKSTIKWDRVYGASKIRIIGVKDGKEKVLKTLKGTATSYTISTAITESNRGYDSIYVVAIKGKQQKTETVYSDYKYLDSTKKVTVKTSGTGAKITWNAVPGATSYTVYRVSPYADKQYSGDYLASTDKNYYVDETIEPGVNYTYYVRAYNGNLNISSVYEQPRVTFNRKLSTTKITSIKNSAAKKATITWKSVASAPKYIVYRSTSKNGKYKKVATTTKTTFTDSKLLKGKTYYYKIKTTGNNAAGLTITSAFSGVKAVKITK